MRATGVLVDTSFVSPASAAAWLGRLRAVVFALWLVKLGGVWLAALASLPIELLDPPWILRPAPSWVWEWLLRAPVLAGLQVSICVLACLAAIGLRPYRAIALAAACLVTLEQALVRSFGYSNHPEMFLILATWIIAVSPAGDGFIWRRRRSAPRPAGIYVAAIAFVALVGCWTYAAAGIYRTAYYGVEMFAGVSMRHAIVLNSFAHGSGAIGALLLERPALGPWIQITLPIATFLEVSGPLALLDRAFRRFWVVFLIAFQLITALSMTILFWESMFTLTAALIAFDRAQPKD